MSPYYEMLRQALMDRTACYCSYDGMERYICPHIIGWKKGNEQTLVWQYGGMTSNGIVMPPGQWKCFKVANIGQLATIADAWHPGLPGKTGMPSSCVDQIDQIIIL